MFEDESTVDGGGATQYVCTQCTNRLQTYAPSPPPACTICGGADWRTTGGTLFALRGVDSRDGATRARV
jgi:hypothetical protein